jgi:ribosomal protein S18 acetylase RimI-like enzyme
MVHIRAATTGDLEIIVALNAFVQRHHAQALPGIFKLPIDSGPTVDAFRAILEDPASVVLMAQDARARGEPVGCLYAEIQDRPASWVRLESQVFCIQHLVVAPKRRRQGVGTALLSEALSVARRRGIKRVELDVWSFNSEARRFWSKHGFEVIRERMQLSIDGV